jgi:uncharacterized protein YfaP (DUF2135 family)
VFASGPIPGAHFDEVVAIKSPVDFWYQMAAQDQADHRSQIAAPASSLKMTSVVQRKRALDNDMDNSLSAKTGLSN